MEEKKIIYDIIVHIWSLLKPFLKNPPQSDDDWQWFIDHEDEYRTENPLPDNRIAYLEHLLFNAVLDYYTSFYPRSGQADAYNRWRTYHGRH